MANRKATFAKRQRETDLKDRAKQKDDRRNQKRGEVRDVKGPAIAWDEAVYAVTTPDDPPVVVDPDQAAAEERPDGPTRPAPDGPTRAAGADGDAPARPATAAAPVTPTAPSAPAAAAKPTAAPTPAPAMSGAANGKPASAPAPASPRRVG